MDGVDRSIQVNPGHQQWAAVQKQLNMDTELTK